MAINNQTISSDMFTDIRSRLVSESITISGSSVSIKAQYNDETDNLPVIVIVPIGINEIMDVFDDTEGTKTIPVTIEVYASNTAKLDNISDQVRYALKQNDISGINLVEINEDYAFTNPNESKFHLKTLVFNYEKHS